MKQARIYMKHWLGINARSKTTLDRPLVLELRQSAAIFDR